LGNIHHDAGDMESALAHYTQAASLLESLPAAAKQEEMRLTVLTNRGGCLVALGRFEPGVASIREAQAGAGARGFRRIGALALTRLGEAYLGRGDREEARRCFQESDGLASREDESYSDVLFLNAFRRWEMAREEGHGTREKIAFGRLRHLRARLERRFPEVDAFDRHVERNRRSHALPA
jgi:tetratricopeptide (TPR) repeat protein